MNSLIHKIYMSCLIAYVYVRHTCCKSPGLQSVSCLSKPLRDDGPSEYLNFYMGVFPKESRDTPKWMVYYGNPY